MENNYKPAETLMDLFEQIIRDTPLDPCSSFTLSAMEGSPTIVIIHDHCPPKIFVQSPEMDRFTFLEIPA